eukprot:gnl/TRDRNA2_/TRDRNA2_210588_c0_seq1.p1 gnl/TRDRNA2_/TRDRNA2_210588_c0~~gnl/TRDRNA2_/TRDRNA2_210588_c0_seq1.p1  ORF type:complete len:118 (+),score=6.00 gnl/TRDRNA2_/TRDRNA2_210588_c0_seq1:155-508(+)
MHKQRWPQALATKPIPLRALTAVHHQHVVSDLRLILAHDQKVLDDKSEVKVTNFTNQSHPCGIHPVNHRIAEEIITHPRVLFAIRQKQLYASSVTSSAPGHATSRHTCLCIVCIRPF